MLDAGRPLRHVDTLQVTPRVSATTLQSRERSAWAVARRIEFIRAGLLGNLRGAEKLMRHDERDLHLHRNLF